MQKPHIIKVAQAWRKAVKAHNAGEWALGLETLSNTLQMPLLAFLGEMVKSCEVYGDEMNLKAAKGLLEKAQICKAIFEAMKWEWELDNK